MQFQKLTETKVNISCWDEFHRVVKNYAEKAWI